MAWANPALPLSRQRIVGRAASGNDGWSFGLDALGKLVLTGYGMADVVSTVPGWQVGTWQHVAVSKSSTGGVTFYVNGNVLESFPLRTEDWNASTAPWKLLGGAGGEEFVGSVDEVKVFPGVLDLQSIREAATNRICSAPDSVVTTPGAVMSDIVIDDLDLVSDLDVKLDLSYPAVGQLSISLTHVGTGHGVFLTHTGESACDAGDIVGTFDDEAAQPASSQCAANPPAITGTFTPSQPLSTFDGDQLRGTWRLSVGAGVAGTGRLNRWCLQAQKSPVQNAIFANGFEYPNIGDVIGVSSVALPRAACNDSQGRTCESLIGNTTADALREAAGAEFAIINSGALRANLTCPTTDSPNDYCPAYTPPPYPISRGQVVTVLPFGNVAMTVLVTGEELKAMLENGVSQMPVPAGRFPQVSGLCFSYDPAVSAGSRILGAVRQAPNGSCTGTAINFSAGVAYVLVENDFMAGGGDGYPNFTGRTTQGERLDGTVIDYVSLHTPITPSIEGRITCSSSGAAVCPVQ
jgi:subtilisin-like proprotein convertase family protein